MSKPFCYVTTKGRVIRSEILEQYAVKAANTDSKQILDAFAGTYQKDGLIQPLYNPEALANLLQINTYHFRACKTKARDVAGLGWFLKPLKDNPSEEQKQKLDDFFSGLDVPIGILLDRLMFDFESIGYGGMEIGRENDDPQGEPTLLAHIPAHTLRVHSSGNKFCQIRGNKKRWFKAVEHDQDVDMFTGIEKAIKSIDPSDRANEVLWLTNYTPRSDFYGLPDVMPALGAIHGDLARRDYNIAFFDNYGVPAYAVFITGNFDPGEELLDPQGQPTGRTALENSIEEHFQALSGAPHSTLVLSVPSKDGNGEVEIKFHPLSVETKDASFRLYRQDNRDEVLAAHGVPPYRMGISETGSLGGSTAAESTEIYKNSIVAPRQEMLEGLINRYIVWSGFQITDWEFKLAEIDTSDEKHDMNMIESLFGMAAITPRQIMAYFGERFGLDPNANPDPMLDAYYVGGQPVTGGAMASTEAAVVMQSLQQKLLEVVAKHASAGNGGGDRTTFEVIGGIQGPGRMGVAGRKQAK